MDGLSFSFPRMSAMAALHISRTSTRGGTCTYMCATFLLFHPPHSMTRDRGRPSLYSCAPPNLRRLCQSTVFLPGPSLLSRRTNTSPSAVSEWTHAPRLGWCPPNARSRHKNLSQALPHLPNSCSCSPLCDFVPRNLILPSPSPTDVASDRSRQCAAERHASATISHSASASAFLAMLMRSPICAHSFAAARSSFDLRNSAAATRYRSPGYTVLAIHPNFSPSLAADSTTLTVLSVCSCFTICSSRSSNTDLGPNPCDIRSTRASRRSCHKYPRSVSSPSPLMANASKLSA